jgi:RNA polymerase sigma factor (sigma-70 family)
MFATSRKKFLATAYSILRNREDAEDAVQEAFLSAYRHLRGFEGRSALRTWLTRIVMNAALMMHRKRKPSVVRSLSESGVSHDDGWTENIPDSQPDPEMIHAGRETVQFIDEKLGQLKPVLRQALTMTYYEDLSGAEASAMLGVSTGTFKARLFRAKRKLLDRTERARVTPIRRTAAYRPKHGNLRDSGGRKGLSHDHHQSKPKNLRVRGSHEPHGHLRRTSTESRKAPSLGFISRALKLAKNEAVRQGMIPCVPDGSVSIVCQKR